MLPNSTKVWIFILISSLALLALGYEVGERLGLLVGFFLAISLNFFVFFHGDSPVLVALEAQELKGQDPWGLRDLINKYADHLGLPYPDIYVIPTKSQTAFCVNRSWRKSSLAISEGLLGKFNRDDLEAVVSLQMCSLKSMDSFLFGVTNTLANALMGLGNILDHFWPPNYFLLRSQKQRPFLKIFTPLSWFLIKLSSSHRSIYQNDLLAAELIHDRFRVAEVIWRLDGLAQTQPLRNIPNGASHLFIVNPEGFSAKHLFLKSHPSIRDRLQRLMGYYPI